MFYTWRELDNGDFFFAELLVEGFRTGYTKDVKNNQTENKPKMKHHEGLGQTIGKSVCY